MESTPNGDFIPPKPCIPFVTRGAESDIQRAVEFFIKDKVAETGFRSLCWR
jgi:hypothetical protein